MKHSEILHTVSVTNAHQLLGLKPPKHPLISIFRDEDLNLKEDFGGVKMSSELYFISFKSKVSGSFQYGRNQYDFQNGTMTFIAPQQVIIGVPRAELEKNRGWSLIFHPDLIRKSQLGLNISKYSFFSYNVNEALHLSLEEQKHISRIAKKIKKEYSQNFDPHSQPLIISNLELMLNYCLRFYDRQFYTRTNFNKDLVAKFEDLLIQYYDSNSPLELGFPSVNYFADKLTLSANYLSDLLRKETGKSTKSHINDYAIEKAKTLILNSSSSITQIAYSLGFEYPENFTKLFKSKVGMSPSKYRIIN